MDHRDAVGAQTETHKEGMKMQIRRCASYTGTLNRLTIKKNGIAASWAAEEKVKVPGTGRS